VLDILELDRVRFYTLVGNHSTIGGKTENAFTCCRFGQLARIKNFNIIGGKEIRNIDGINFGFIDYLRKPKRINFNFKKQPTVIVSHNYWVPSCIGDPAPSAKYIDKIQELNNTRLVLLGHYHQPFKYAHNKTLYINPGSIMRITCCKDNINRIPQVILVDIKDKLEQPNIEYISLTVNKNPFKVDEKKANDKWDKNIQNFIQELNDVRKKFSINYPLRQKLRHMIGEYNKKGVENVPINVKAIKMLLMYINKVHYSKRD
jgi:DNA repair exonuclease SbcCD nuclease subunit